MNLLIFNELVGIIGYYLIGIQWFPYHKALGIIFFLFLIFSNKKKKNIILLGFLLAFPLFQLIYNPNLIGNTRLIYIYSCLLSYTVFIIKEDNKSPLYMLLFFLLILMIMMVENSSLGYEEFGKTNRNINSFFASLMLYAIGTEYKYKKIFFWILLISLTIVTYYLTSRSSALIVIALIILLSNYKKIVKHLLISGIFLLTTLLALKERIENESIESLGRELVFKCFYERYDPFKNIISGYDNYASNCGVDVLNTYLHSTHLVALNEFGLLLYSFGVITIFINIKSAVLNLDLNKTVFYVFFVVYGLIEPGLEWIYLFSIFAWYRGRSRI
ncbi:hypothetical protein G6735_04760 [Polynucleobacter paneuropaeus]|nr:hypothetical protein [Polynucleobacter paneuropaeus]